MVHSICGVLFMKQNYNRQSGFGAFAYILMSIALLAALTGAISRISQTNSRAQANDVLVARIYGQASKIRADIQLCMTERTKDTEVGPLRYRQFPVCNGGTSNSAFEQNTNYFSDLYCPSNSAGTIFANARALRCKMPTDPSVWDNAEGNFFPERITGYEEWKYYISSSGTHQGVSLMITPVNRAANADTDWVLRRVAARFGANEARVMKRTADDDATTINVSACTGLCNTLQIWLAGSN